jgi:nanoRNase/pAp phosphatase (c-di-AMP/oligoRNAs hydrolase)
VNSKKEKIIEQIKDIFDREDDFLILTHKNADVDAVGSILALKYYLQEKNKRVTAACDSVNSQAKIFLENMNEELDRTVEEFRNVIIVDTASVKKLGIFEDTIEKAEHSIIIDHHEKTAQSKEFFYYNEQLPSNTEIIYKFFPLNDEKYLKVILAGIIADTGYFKYASTETFGTVYKILKKGINLQEMFVLLKNEIDRSRKIAVLKAVRRMKIHTVRDFIVTTTRVGAHEALAAKALLSLGADISFVASKERISSRTTDAVIQRGINLAEIMHAIGRLENGDGGGHKAAAGAEDLDDVENALKTCVKLVKERLDTDGR